MRQRDQTLSTSLPLLIDILWLRGQHYYFSNQLVLLPAIFSPFLKHDGAIDVEFLIYRCFRYLKEGWHNSKSGKGERLSCLPRDLFTQTGIWPWIRKEELDTVATGGSQGSTVCTDSKYRNTKFSVKKRCAKCDQWEMTWKNSATGSHRSTRKTGLSRFICPMFEWTPTWWTLFSNWK